ncbi:hypothetical protein QFC20_006701 [Naganishia adeliensis]|uniref:Uncharacterized protein n=1 Tax=Naganishia adeliensis TaxID=92952 RepID=A0ACC2V7S6_9TREE|nr:hypothetical protein QFC20_006701 [Naganishia adeliensis]
MTGTPTLKQEQSSGPSAASKRREANRLAAARFRTRKKDQVTELENRVHDLEAENFHLKAVNRTLRKRCAVPDDQTVEVDDEFAAGRPAWRREVAGERFVSERAASEAAAEFMESPTGGGDPSKKRRRTGGKGAGDPMSSAGAYHHLDRSVSASGDGDPYVQLQDENDRLQNQMRAYEDRLRNMTDELVGLRYRVREETGNGSEGSDQSPETNYRHPGPTYAPAPTYTPFTLDPALTGAAGDPRYNGLSPSTSHANPVLTLASAASNARVLQRQSSQGSLVLPLSPAMRLGGDVPPMGYGSPSGGSLSVNTLLDNTAARVSPSMAHQQPYGSRPGSPMTIRAFEALTEAVAAVDAQAAHEASLSSPNTGTGGGGGSIARRAWNMQPNNNLGPLTSLSRTSSRGMDSPVSAERSGLAGDEDDSDEYMAAAAAAHLPGTTTSSTRHMAGTSVLSSSRDASPIGSSLEYFDRRMGGAGVARSVSGTGAASGRGGSKLRDMDIDMDAASVVIPGVGVPTDDMATAQLDPALTNPQQSEPESSNATPAATFGALPPPLTDQGPISQDQAATPTAVHPDEAVPRIAFQQVQ